MKAKFKYKGYTIDIHPIENAKSNYDTMIYISKKNVLDWGTSIRGNEPINVLFEIIERIISK